MDTKLESLLACIPHLDAKDIELVRRAYYFAQKAHEGQERNSGEPYFTHVFETAKILAELGMGPKTVSAGLLHDTIEDTEVNEEEFKQKFGEEILFLVQGVTKLGKVRFQGAMRHIESLRKLFIATSKDVRVLIIKLADRLHNMRTLEHVKKEKQERIAKETLEIYAPIAYRLGIYKINSELQDLSFFYLKRNAYDDTFTSAKFYYDTTTERLQDMYKKLDGKLKEEKIFISKVDYRRKNIYSIWKKLQSKDYTIDQIYDIAAMRIIVPTLSDCYRALGVVHSIWRPLPGRIKDYIAFPKPNGYKSIHTTVFTGDGAFAEIQIRTESMHKEAEFGIASHSSYKGNKKNTRLTKEWFMQLFPISKQNEHQTPIKREVPLWVQQIASDQIDTTDPETYIQELTTDFLDERIFVFTPKGDVIDLPSNATPIDFAYHIHSDIGEKIQGAKVNGKMTSLDKNLQSGDIIEILTNKNAKPTRKWLDIAKTNLAKRHIKNYLYQKTRH